VKGNLQLQRKSQVINFPFGMAARMRKDLGLGHSIAATQLHETNSVWQNINLAANTHKFQAKKENKKPPTQKRKNKQTNSEMREQTNSQGYECDATTDADADRDTDTYTDSDPDTPGAIACRHAENIGGHV